MAVVGLEQVVEQRRLAAAQPARDDLMRKPETGRCDAEADRWLKKLGRLMGPVSSPHPRQAHAHRTVTGMRVSVSVATESISKGGSVVAAEE